MGQRLSRNTRYSVRVHPAITPSKRTSSFIRPAKEYTSDGRLLVHTPVPLKGDPGSITIVFIDGSYIIGKVNAQTKDAEGYCEYRDIANRLIYTGYMYENAYNGWGSIWDESGTWPEYTTYWSMSRPANRVLHTTQTGMEWDCTLDGSCDKEGVKSLPIKPLVMGSKQIYSNICHSFANHKIGSSEPLFQEMIKLYVKIRENPHQTPPSPNIAPINIVKKRVFSDKSEEPSFIPLTPPTPHKSPDIRNARIVSNPLRVRVPPETYKTKVENV